MSIKVSSQVSMQMSPNNSYGMTQNQHQLYRSSLAWARPTPCAFHSNQLITHFCRAKECLLPLCEECIVIHRKEHLNIRIPFEPIGMVEQIYRFRSGISTQMKKMIEMKRQVENRFGDNNQLHVLVLESMLKEKDELMRSIGAYYDALIVQISDNFRERQKWIHNFLSSYELVMNEFRQMERSLTDEGYLRTMIMWERIAPEKQISNICLHSKEELQRPSFVPFQIRDLLDWIIHERKITVLDLEGDMGIGKLIQTFNLIRIGDASRKPRLKQSQIMGKHGKKLTITKSTGTILSNNHSFHPI